MTIRLGYLVDNGTRLFTPFIARTMIGFAALTVPGTRPTPGRGLLCGESGVSSKLLRSSGLPLLVLERITLGRPLSRGLGVGATAPPGGAKFAPTPPPDIDPVPLNNDRGGVELPDLWGGSRAASLLGGNVGDAFDLVGSTGNPTSSGFTLASGRALAGIGATALDVSLEFGLGP